MSGIVTQRPTARRDIVAHYVYLAEKAGEDVAERFIASLESSVALLASQPSLGAPLQLRLPELQGLRKWRVAQFENVLIFYKPRPDGISLVRVLHTAQDGWRLLDIEP